MRRNLEKHFIKNSIQTTLTHAYAVIKRMGIDVATLGYGIQVTVTSNPAFWSNTPGHPGYLVTHGLTCRADIVGEPSTPALGGVDGCEYRRAAPS